jgi:hypothetical protein
MPTPVDAFVADSPVSFAGLFYSGAIREIEIPMIQRDYAQGRSTIAVTRIRDSFLATLLGALLPGSPPVDLDFVFGDIEEYRFYPLDGQQRLTTLFLLHCYMSWQTGTDGSIQPWAKFSYATRPGARAFCVFLTEVHPDLTDAPSHWIRDQPGYLPTWEFDPTIASMLTMIDAMHAKVSAIGLDDFHAAFARLTDVQQPAIRFHILPVRANGLSNQLYIKMNSRGKPLTAFENFKAHFEVVLKSAGHIQADQFAKNVDTIWSDMLWDYRGNDNVIDDEFMRLFRCLTEINAWKANIAFHSSIRDDDLAVLVYGAGQPDAVASVSFLFRSLDIWQDRNISVEFHKLLARPGAQDRILLPIFNAFENEGVDLFAACCCHHGDRQWTLAHTILFYGVLVGLNEGLSIPVIAQRLRVLRNLIEASSDEIRAGERNNMPKLLAETTALILEGNLAAVATFNQAQAADERAKATMLDKAPALAEVLHTLEDHDLLRGGLTAFDLDPTHFAARAATFIRLFNKAGDSDAQPYIALTGALLAQGDYGRRFERTSGYATCDLGAPKNDEPWRALLRGRKRENMARIVVPLRGLLDAATEGQSLSDIAGAYLATTARKDWRFYFVKYASMRSGASGRYLISAEAGMGACMLDKYNMTSDYYDPYLLAIVIQSDTALELISTHKWPRAFTGWETTARELTLKKSQCRLRCIDEGWQLSVPDFAYDRLGATQLEELGLVSDGQVWKLQVTQLDGVDTDDRIDTGAKLLSRLIAAGM